MPNERKTKKSKEESESEEVQERTSPGGHIVYAAVYEEGMHELERTNSALAWSGIAAGLAMGFSLLTEGVLRSRLPDAPWRPLIEKFGYSIGFLMVVLGRQQLFTENTLTVILPLLRKPRMRMFINVARLWSIVLCFNLLGTFVIAWIMGNTNMVSPEVRHAMQEIGHTTMSPDFGTLVIRGIFAGFMIAIMVWLLPFAETARVSVIIIITYVVGIAELAHVIVGSVDAFYMVAIGQKSMLDYFAYMGPVLLGNIIGGSTIVATIAHAQYVEEDQGA